MSFPYEDIVHLPRPISGRHARMSNADRAAQFSPFAALSGHQDAIDETARLTEGRIELAEDAQTALNQALRALVLRLPEKPLAAITSFVRDQKKPGGAYVTRVCRVVKVDWYTRELITQDGVRLPVEDIYSLLLE